MTRSRIAMIGRITSWRMMGGWRRCLGKLANRGGRVVWLLLASGMVGCSLGGGDVDVDAVE